MTIVSPLLIPENLKSSDFDLGFGEFDPGGGGGGTQMLFGRGCEAEASKPVPIFKGNFGGKGYPLLGFGGKGYPLLGVFSQENDVFVYFSDEMGENI